MRLRRHAARRRPLLTCKSHMQIIKPGTEAIIKNFTNPLISWAACIEEWNWVPPPCRWQLQQMVNWGWRGGGRGGLHLGDRAPGNELTGLLTSQTSSDDLSPLSRKLPGPVLPKWCGWIQTSIHLSQGEEDRNTGPWFPNLTATLVQVLACATRH